MNNWEDLSITEKAAIMKSAVKNGVTNLQDIRREYNEFSKGGPKKKSSVNPTAQRAMRYFMDKGLTDYQAAGLVGNLMRESGMSPTALNSSSGAYGLAQWLGARKKALFNKYGKNPTLDNQLDFIWSELNSSHRNGLRHLKASKNATEAARNAMGYYEFSVGPEGAVREMKKYGQDGEGSMRKGINNASILMGQPVPAYTPTQTQSSAPRQYQGISYAESIPDEIEFTPSNPEAFFAPIESYRYPDLELATETEDPLVEAANAYSQEALEREQRMDNLSKLNMLLGMTGGSNGNSYLNTISMLANTFAEGGDTVLGTNVYGGGGNKKSAPRKTVYKAKYTGKVYDTAREAAADNYNYLNNAEYRYRVKSGKVSHPSSYSIPFIESKRRTLTNAGLATGAVISENLLDSIAKHAKAAGLPVKTGLGLAVKESTLGNPTDDRSVYKILNPQARAYFISAGTGQHINDGRTVRPEHLLNFFVDSYDPYTAAMQYATSKAKTKNGQIDEDKYNNLLVEGESYADSKVKEYEETYGKNNTLYNAFKYYKENPFNYNPGQPNYQQLVNKRADEVWNSPEVQEWYKNSVYNGYASGGGIEYSYTKPLDNVYIDSEGNVLDPSVPSAKGTIRTPDVVIATRDPRKAVPTANSLNTSNIESTVKETIKNYFVGNLSDDEVRRRLYHNLAPYGYTHTIARLESAIKNNTSHEFDRRHKNDRDRQDIWAEYLGIPEEERKALFDSSTSILRDSQYSPSVGKEQNIKYKAISNPSEADVRDLIQHAEVLPIGKNKVVAGGIGHALGRYTIGHNYDNKGEYVSYYDKWDLNPFSNAGDDLSLGIGKPVNIYDRIYLDDYYGLPEEYRGSTYIPELTVTANKHANGGKIHIKPSHRGRLTELKKRTGKSEAELYKTGGPAVRKMITFARSARKWNKHDLGGYL